MNLLGTYDNDHYTFISPDTIAFVQARAAMLGHVLGVVVAHDRALRAHARSTPLEQLPLVVATIGFTVGTLALLFGA